MPNSRPLNIMYHILKPNHTDEFLPNTFYLELESIRGFFESSLCGDEIALQNAVAYIFDSPMLNRAFEKWVHALLKYALWCKFNREKIHGWATRHTRVIEPCDIYNIDDFAAWANSYNPVIE